MRVLIIGAGIGGLTAALKLHQIGFEVEVFEAVAELKELGVGINLLPHATRELAELNLLDSLNNVSVSTTQLEFRTKDGRLILTEPRGLNAGYSYPQLSIHRGKLQNILLNAFYERIGREKLHLSHKFKSFIQSNNHVKAKFADPQNNHVSEYSGDILIGADGIHSAVRAQLHPNEKAMQFEGIMMWRGATYQAPPFNGSTVEICGNPAIQLVIYPITPRDDAGKALVNWVVEILDPVQSKLHKENWNRRGDIKDFIAYFSDWQLDFLDLNELFNNANKILEYPMVDRDPVTFWSQDRVTLLGDAAHPMYPRGSNGASQAIIDASWLAVLLQQNDPITAFKKYDLERIPTTSQIILANRRKNQTLIFELIQKNCKGTCGNVHTCVEKNVLQKITEDYKHQAGFSLEQVNK